MRLVGWSLVVALDVVTSAQAEPIGIWWSGGAMGTAEYGFSHSEDTYFLISCGDEYSRTTILTSINGRSPSPETSVDFNIDGETIEMWTDAEGIIGTYSHVYSASFEMLIPALRSGNRLTISFDGISQDYPLAGSSSALRSAEECVTDYAR